MPYIVIVLHAFKAETADIKRIVSEKNKTIYT